MAFSIVVDQFSPVSEQYEPTMTHRASDHEKAIRIFQEHLAVITKTRALMQAAGRPLPARRVTLFQDGEILCQEQVEGIGFGTA